MARRAGSLFVTKQSTPWAGNSGANVVELADVSGGAIVVGDGLPTEYDADRYLQSGLYNKLNFYFWDTFIDLGQYGIFAWDDEQPFKQYARTIGSDGVLYKCKQDHTGEDPTTDSTNTYWEAESGAVATDTEVEAGSDTSKAVTPAGLQSLFVADPNARWHGTEDQYGLARLATSNEVDAATDGEKVVTPASLRRNLLAPLASPTLTGSPRAPTPPSGNNSTRIATTEFVQDETAGLAARSYVDNEVADAGASYVLLSTAPSVTTTSNWIWGALEAGADAYVSRTSSNSKLTIRSTPPRAFVGLMFEILVSGSVRARGIMNVSPRAFSLGMRLDEATVRTVRITPENSTSPSAQNLTGETFSLRWDSQNRLAGYEARVYAIVV